MINDLEKKLNGTIPVNRNDLIKLINSWGRTYECYIHDEFNNEIYINKKSPKECYDLSNLDVSEITDLSYLFIGSLYNGDLSKWNTKSCENMSIMFYHSFFNNDSLKDWNTSNVKNLEYMFNSSKFNGDLSNWNLLKVTNTRYMFTRSMFNNNSISNWNISNILDMNNMFSYSIFNGDISNWNVSKLEDMNFMFAWSQFNGDLSKWNISNVIDMDGAFFDGKFDGDTNEFKKKTAFLFKFFNEIFVSLKQCGLNYVIARQLQFKRSSIFLKTLFLSKKIDSDINKKLSFLFSKWKFDNCKSCSDIFYANEKFEQKYNNKEEIPFYTKEFLEWFETNRLNISNSNVSKEEKLDIDNYLSNFEIDTLSNDN